MFKKFCTEGELKNVKMIKEDKRARGVDFYFIYILKI
jgi:hypothetical protein